MLVESITPHERDHLLDVAVGTQLFNLDEAESL